MITANLEIDAVRLYSVVVAVLLLGLASCSSTGSLDYAPTVPITAGPPASVASVTATDTRDEKPNRLATVRGGYGNPAYVRDTARPVAEEVAGVFTKALQARGMLSPNPNAPYRVQLVLRTFYANKYLSRAAYIDIDFILVDRSGRTVYHDAVKDERDQFKLFDADIDALQGLAQSLLNATADRILDNPKLRAVLSSPPASGAPSA